MIPLLRLMSACWPRVFILFVSGSAVEGRRVEQRPQLFLREDEEKEGGAYWIVRNPREKRKEKTF